MTKTNKWYEKEREAKMTDTEVFAMWKTLHENWLRKERDQFERDTGYEIPFNEFALIMYYEGQDMLKLNHN